MAKRKMSASRRGFLISVGAGSVATAAAVVHSVTPESEAATIAPRPSKKGGYQVSDHINKYYRTTRV
ncbi:MAG TPA: formate dehydrogenase [Burkholderiales bacterium]|nr:formate dehydrogenase [Burkholderiales bacterium]